MTVKEASVAANAEQTDPTAGGEDSRSAWLKGIIGRVRKRASAPEKNRWSGKIGAGILTLLVVASLLTLAAIYRLSYRPDRDVDAEAAKAAIAAASEGTVAILSYSPDTLDRDFSTARSHLTGDFLSNYEQFTQQIVGPAAKQKSLKTTAEVLRSALTEFHPDLATVLLFVNQSTQTKDQPEPSTMSSSVLATLTKADGKWLISQFNPA